MTEVAIASFAEVFAAALRGTPAHVVGLHPADHPLPVDGWSAAADASDRTLLAHCRGATLDVGCGPGRMSAHLAGQGQVVLGIDIVPAAVDSTRGRGAAAIQRSVFDPLPDEGRWDSALLADGNIGIGGDPVAMLSRLRQLLVPGGRVVCDLAPPGTGLVTRLVHLACGEVRTGEFLWSLVGPEALPALARASGLVVTDHHQVGDRHYAVLHST